MKRLRFEMRDRNSGEEQKWERFAIIKMQEQILKADKYFLEFSLDNPSFKSKLEKFTFPQLKKKPWVKGWESPAEEVRISMININFLCLTVHLT